MSAPATTPKLAIFIPAIKVGIFGGREMNTHPWNGPQRPPRKPPFPAGVWGGVEIRRAGSRALGGEDPFILEAAAAAR